MAFDLASAQPVEQPKAGFDLSTAQPVGEEQPKRTIAEQIARGLGRTARAAIRAGTDVVGTVANAPAAAFNLAAEAYDKVRSPTMGELVTGKQPGFRFPDQTKFGERLADFFGLPKAESASERIAEDVAAGMGTAGGMVKAGDVMGRAGNALVKRVGEVLATNRRSQIVAGGTGPGAASVVREEGGGPVAQVAAGVAGSLAPAAAAGARAAVRGAVRGGEAGRQRVADTIDSFEDAGAGTPTVGQATQSRVARAVESALAKALGGAGRMTAKAEAEAAGMGAKVEQMTSQLSPRAGAEPAGRAIKAGIDDFVRQFKADAGVQYDRLDRHLPKGSRVEVANTRAALESLNADIPGAPNVSQLFKNARMKGIEGALKADVDGVDGVYAALPAWQRQLLDQMPPVQRTATLNGLVDGKLPYEALKKLRTLVGDELATPSLVSDVPRSKWKALYAALSEDLGAAARESGPQAERALRRANRFYEAGMKRVDDVLSPIVAKGDPEDIFRAATSGTKEGATTIRGVMKSLPDESQRVLSATMLRRLGKATPGNQNDLGEVFSAETFLTNWNRMAPEAKKSLFAPMTPRMRRDLDEIAAVAANMREGSKVFANPSGTAQAAANNITTGAALVSLLTGQWHVAGSIAAGVAGSNLAARLMTNPDFVRFLAGSAKAPIEQIPAQLNQLFQLSMNMKRSERRDVRDFIKQTREGLRQLEAQPTQ